MPARLVATKPFGGIVTEEEVARQTKALLEALAAEGSGVAPLDASQVSVLQYNSPFTIPWRRRNEVAVVVEEKSAPVVSWYDSGERLR